MHRATRALAFGIIATLAFGACKRKPAPQTPPPQQPPTQTVSNPPAPAPTETCDAACRAAAADEARRRAIANATAMLTTTIYFEYDASDITDDSRAKLDAKVPVLTQNTGVRIRISGHTDSRGSDEYNLALGQRRAAAAKRYLTDRGIDGGRIEIVSFGEERPKCTDEAESCWLQNRRDEFEITVGTVTAVQMSSSQ
jgi:peptidoglycan-associated lipoprotein